ncbi:MAG: hypothetical protein GX774_01615 [Armatimonadetes bacterium]|nr:hypothetical protein [Armatimonadota bacterium]
MALLALPAWAQTPVLKEASSAGTELLRNGNFRQAEGEHAAGWVPYASGYRRVPGGGPAGGDAILCENATADGQAGASQFLELKRSQPAPLVVTGWSKAEAVSGTPGLDYALYVDLTYTDGTTLWAQAAPFSTGTHDWEQREIRIVPEKPVAVLSFNCLLRGRAGRAWFAAVSVREIGAGAEATLFDGEAVQRGTLPRPGRAQSFATRNGLSLSCDRANWTVPALRLGGRQVRVPDAPSGFLARDAAAGPAVYPFPGGRCQALGLSLTAAVRPRKECLVIEGQVRDERGKDRAITLFFALPFPRAEGVWHDDGRRSRPLTSGEYSVARPVGSGATGTMSRYPWACVTGPAGGLAVGIDMDRPAQYRLFYHADLQALVVAFDLALVKETKRFPSAAPFRFVVYPVDPTWGFRSAAERYQRLFPAAYVVRSKQQGIWIPFTDVSTIQGWQDFGIRYHEGDNNVPFDDAAGILSFAYQEISTYWMPMPPEMPRTPEAALAELQRLHREGDPEQRRWAAATLSALIHDANGQPQFQFLKMPWCDGAVWSLCPLPDIAGEPNAATFHWNKETRAARHGPGAKGTLDGEYLDSLEGYVTADLNFRREHFAAVRAPLTFETGTGRPAIPRFLAVWELTRWMAADVHAMGKLMFANTVPHRYSFLTAYLDVMGTEVDWLPGGTYQPANDETLLYWRTLSGAKPYLLLMNTDHEKLVPALTERYFQRCLFYGIFPSMFSHNACDDPYWANPAWYNRDRHLFKRYIPVIRRVAEAGWRPVTGARCREALVERFGPGADGKTYFTLHNPGDQPVEAELRLEAGAPAAAKLVDLVTGEAFSLSGRSARVPLGPDQARALEMQ